MCTSTCVRVFEFQKLICFKFVSDIKFAQPFIVIVDDTRPYEEVPAVIIVWALLVLDFPSPLQ